MFSTWTTAHAECAFILLNGLCNAQMNLAQGQQMETAVLAQGHSKAQHSANVPCYAKLGSRLLMRHARAAHSPSDGVLRVMEDTPREAPSSPPQWVSTQKIWHKARRKAPLFWCKDTCEAATLLPQQPMRRDTWIRRDEACAMKTLPAEQSTSWRTRH
ncbi:hypothetical protein HAX54_019730 [Datura stramonium]|uniref:Uncharacterized protein n=1 Tax=Datura stramonium TaxID=4076 RepID=A0ABS8US30_DATST|nr:hypothetical protein [Datura stramonium]